MILSHFQNNSYLAKDVGKYYVLNDKSHNPPAKTAKTHTNYYIYYICIGYHYYSPKWSIKSIKK